jgi:uncharacterized protein YlxP (DUF503 family)
MIVGLCTIQLQLPASTSLKAKRQVLQAVVDRVHNKFNVSIAEVDHQDSWHQAALAIACVATDAGYVHGLLERVVHFIAEGPFALVLLDYEIELV